VAFASHWIMLGLLLGFAVAHSGLASLRMGGEAIIGARLYRVLFALVSIPLAVILVVYFFNHRYDGLLLWQVQGVTGVKTLVWILSAISFFPPLTCWRSPLSKNRRFISTKPASCGLPVTPRW